MEISAHSLLPATGSDGVALRHDMSRRGQDQRPGKFDRRVRAIPRVNHCDPMVARGGHIDRRVSRSRRGNELEIGKALNDVAGQRGSLAHDTNNIKRPQPLNQGIRIGEVVLKYGDVRSIAEHRPIGALKRRILVIVQNSDLVSLHWHPSRSDCFEPSRPATKPRLPNRQFTCQGLTLAFAPRSIAKRRSADGNLSFMALIRLSGSLAFLSSSSKTNK